MVFYLIGLGLGNPEDVTVKGLKAIKSADRVYLEAYTSILTCGKSALEEFYGRSIILADRDMVEQNSNELLRDAKKQNVVFLVVGDPFGATTHSDLVLRALEQEIPYKVIHNASIMNAVGCCGLQLYNFGETVSIVFWTDTWKPSSFCDKINENLKRGMHTLCLLDIKVKEQSIENLMRGKKVYEPPRYMTSNLACQQLLEVVEDKQSESENILTKETMCVSLACVGSDEQKIVAAPLNQLVNCELGPVLHSLIITGTLHPLEYDFLKQFLPKPK
uniref:diphthine methyl ester synthase-like isoform X1 n=1 Tax=Ciona intestinalis TaxID=7719 RepID=UPI000521386E|nr:diphthine methyl ester synthase-like isoform X1 [Ciona intestinalis]|eukprot:XP_009858689.1 diphthine methyl ester synthase-like isoform X1 [Ciona intestinalis]